MRKNRGGWTVVRRAGMVALGRELVRSPSCARAVARAGTSPTGMLALST